MGDPADVRRREATRAFIKYFVLAFLVVCALAGITVYAIYDSRVQRDEARAIRMEYCVELEKLKTQNREDVQEDRENYERNLRLLGIKDSAELRKTVEREWDAKEKRNAAKPCPYTA